MKQLAKVSACRDTGSRGTYQMMIIRNEDRAWGNPKATKAMTGQNSEKEPAGRR